MHTLVSRMSDNKDLLT